MASRIRLISAAPSVTGGSAHDESPEWIKKWVMWGPGPRAVPYLVLGAQARAVLQSVADEDVSNAAFPYYTSKSVTIGTAPALALLKPPRIAVPGPAQRRAEVAAQFPQPAAAQAWARAPARCSDGRRA